METIRVHDKVFKEYLSADLIQQRVSELAAQINTDYINKRPLFLAILNGSFMFAADLFRQVSLDAEI